MSDEHAFLVNDVGVARLPVLDGVRDFAQQRGVEPGNKHGLDPAVVAPDGGSDNDDRRVGHFADDDAGDDCFTGHGFLEVVPGSKGGGRPVRVFCLAVGRNDAHTQILHPSCFVFKGWLLHIPVHGADHVTVGDALNDDKVVIESTSDQLCPAVSHEDNVFVNLAEGGVFGSVIGDVAQANADEREQNQKTTDEFHANRNIFHCRLRVMDESKLHQVWSIHFEQLRTTGQRAVGKSHFLS
ncbi:hypothetical protein DSECCO2_480760 [anaerobic digester metagenome]